MSRTNPNGTQQLSALCLSAQCQHVKTARHLQYCLLPSMCKGMHDASIRHPQVVLGNQWHLQKVCKRYIARRNGFNMNQALRARLESLSGGVQQHFVIQCNNFTYILVQNSFAFIASTGPQLVLQPTKHCKLRSSASPVGGNGHLAGEPLTVRCVDSCVPTVATETIYFDFLAPFLLSLSVLGGAFTTPSLPPLCSAFPAAASSFL